MSKRTWIKIYCEKLLEHRDSSVPNQLSLSDIGVFILLLCIAGNGSYADIGVLKLSKNVPISDRSVSELLDISVKQWQRYKDRFVQLGMIEILPNNIIKITNWTKYQSEYNRQKGYRQSDSKGYNKTFQKNSTKLQGRREEKENKKRVKSYKQFVDNSNNGSGLTPVKDITDEVIQEPETTDIEPF